MSKMLIGLVLLMPALAFAQGGQPSITSVVFKSPSVAGGRPATATITLSGPAPNNGFEVGLSITSNVAQLASSAITIGSGQTSATVQVTTSPTATAQLAVLSATARGETRTGNLTVSPPAAVSLTLAPASVTAGQQATATITLDGPAPAGGTQVTLSSSSSTVTVQSSATIAQGQTSANVSLATSNVNTPTNATLTATAGGGSRSATLAVNPAPISITSIGFPASPKSGESVTLTAQASAPAPAGGLIVQFASSGATLFGITTSTRVDTIPAGSASLSRTFDVSRTNTDRPFTLTATLNGTTTSRSGTLLAPRLISVNLIDSVAGGGIHSMVVAVDAAIAGSFPGVVTSDNSALTVRGSSLGAPTIALIALETNPVVQRTVVNVTLTYLGSTRTERITLLPGPPLLERISASPVLVRAGGSVVLTVSLDRPAPKPGTVVQLSATGLPLGMTLPASLTVPVGETTGSITVATPSRVPSSATTTVTARLDLRNRAVQVRIDP